MYPLKFEKVLKPKVWGGRLFETFLSVTLPGNETFGESWEVSAHPNGSSVVAQGDWKGKSLPELLAEHREKLIGQANWDRFGGKFPLLIKYLDINDKLSVQVHPEDAYALEHEGEFGKSECWYIMHASPDAALILGMAPGVDQESFRQKVSSKDFSGLFREVSVQTGDFIHVTPGTVHASIRGSVLICEIQQNSDTTYRIYDFDRLENGKLRPLHLDKALDVINFQAPPTVTHGHTRSKSRQGDALVEPLVRDPYYHVDLIHLDGQHTDATGETFAIYSVLEGSAHLSCQGKGWTVKKGDTWFIPPALSVSLEGKVEYIRSWI